MPSPLPIDAVLPSIVRTFTDSSNVVLEAPPGAGKTTRVPPALLPAVPGDVIVLEPRRLAARMAARRVAEELGERVGQTAGYQVRFEEVSGPQTRLRFVTEGVLTRRLLSDPKLRNVSAVVLDEFHERHLDTDLSLALLRRLQRTERPGLKLIVMSATLNAGPIAEYLDNCPVIRSEGRLFDVDVSYTPHSATPVEEQVAAAVQRVEIQGSILVFLPGAAEIRKAMRQCEDLARSRGLLMLPLYGDLPPEEQDRAVLPSSQPKLILSTNIAESSVTIEGVTTVIDSGLARIASDSPWTGLPALQVQRIAKASAVQRAGRAGRTQPGRAIRLYSFEDFQRRPDQDLPEIRRRELSQVVLELRALNVADPDWFEAPPSEVLAAADALLDRLGAKRDAAALARLPVHPRLARLIVDGERRGAAAEAVRLAALLSSGDRFDSARLDSTNVFEAIEQPLSHHGRQIEKQLRRFVSPRSRSGSDEGFRLAILSAFPDRVIRRGNDLLVAIDAEERRGSGPPVIRLSCAISSEDLAELFPDRLQESQELVWNREGERVEARNLVRYDDVIVEETRSQPKGASADAMLAAQALDAGLHRFIDVDELENLMARSEFASAHSDLPQLTDADAASALTRLCEGLRSFKELETLSRSSLIPLLKEMAGGERALNEIAPERLPLKNRQVKVNYARGQQPWIASRLQDFFGLRETPRIAWGQVAVLVHLLAPNQRPVQVTADLAGFWERLYPQVRRELSRRYPRHSWPEIPG